MEVFRNRPGNAETVEGAGSTAYFIHDDETQQGLGALVTLHDLESVEEIESELELSRRMAAIGRLTSGVGHEVKNPINAIVIHLAILRERILTLPAYLAVLPTHGAGSSCTSSGASAWRWTTLGFERLHNPAAIAALATFDEFRARISRDLPVAPAYYPHVRALNPRGAAPADRGPIALLRDPLAADLVLVDPRPTHVFAAGHRRGAVNVVGNDSFASRVGAVVPFDAPIVLLTTNDERAETLRARLAAIGFDEVRGMAEPLPNTGEDLGRVRLVDVSEALKLAEGGEPLLDVREIGEGDEGHAPNAVHVPYELLERRLAAVPH